MPIYEFQCEPCRTVFQFFSRRVDTRTCPPCPKCGRPLSRKVSAIAYLQGGGDGDADGLGDVRLDENRMEKALDAMGDALDAAGDSDDAMSAAETMKRFSDASGLRFNSGLRDAVERLAAGADPETVGAEIDEMVGTMAEKGETPFVSGDDSGTTASSGRAAPERPWSNDPTLYDM